MDNNIKRQSDIKYDGNKRVPGGGVFFRIREQKLY